MQCAEFESRLNDLLDERLRLDADFLLAEHARGCRECRNLAAAYEAVVSGLEQSRPGEPRADLTARVLADVAIASGDLSSSPSAPGDDDSRPSLPQRRRRFDGRYLHRRVSTFAALAAAVLLAVVLRWAVAPLAQRPIANDAPAHHARLAGEQPTAKPLAKHRTQVPAFSGAASVRSPYGDEYTTGDNSLRGLAAEASQSFAVAMQLFPGVDALSPEAGQAAASDTAAGWVHGLSDGLKPVTRPTAGAMNSFWQLLASGEEGSRS